jgi:DNA-binding winged helix-turn-helix (wHTH) protein/tetratricopeptide (TPR) repeat protein
VAVDVRPSRVLRFPPFRLDPGDASLWRGTSEVRLTPKAFAVLQCLVEHHGQLVTKDALLERVWPGTVVGDAVLKVCVREIRKAMGDQVDAPRFVATVHRRGYRFIADVTDVDPRPGRGEAPGKLAAEAAATTRTSYRRPAHFVGREPVLDRLQAGLEAAWRGQRQVVFVTGEPGIGKTGVVEAFLERVAADPRVWIAQGQCVETYGTREPYPSVLDALGRLCRETGGDWLVTLLRRHAPTWLMQMPWLLDPAGRAALRRELLGSTRERVLREMAEAVEALTADAPLVVVLEDLHWSDAATVDLVSFLARRPQPARLLLIGTYRPVDLIARQHPLKDVKLELQAAGRCRELSLELLGQAAVADYLGDRFVKNAFPPGLAQVINRRTEGNPLFMVSVVDDLVGRGLIGMGDDRWELRAGLPEVEVSVPESLRQMIERRIEQLSGEERRILAAGSVAGMEFSAASVAAALKRPTGEVEERCNELARRQLFIRFLGAREWPDRTVASRYGFLHALHRSALYQGITPTRRREWHQAIGEREEIGHGDRADEIASQLAAHFEQSGDDRRAVRYLAETAETASRRHANAEAVGYVSRALDIAERLPGEERVAARLGLLKQLGLLRRAMGDVRDSIEDFTARARYAREHGRGDEEVRALLELGGALSWVDRDRSLAAVEQALALVPRLPDEALQAHVRSSHAFQRILLRGWRDEDAETCRLSLDIVRRVGERRHLSLHVGRYAHLHNHRSEYRAACRTAEEALRLAVEVSDAYHYMAAQYHRAWALLHLGEWGELCRVLRDGLEMAERNGHHLWARAFRFQTAWLFTHVGEFVRARELCERERRPGEELQLGVFMGSVVLGFAELGLRQFAAALRAFEEVGGRSEGDRLALMDWILSMPWRLGLGECWLARRQFARAREQMEELCRLAAAPGERTYLALGHRGRAEAALGEGDRATAERQVAEAIAVLDGFEAPLAEWRVYATAAQIEEARDRRSRAEAYWRRSVAALDRLATSLKDDDDLCRSFLVQPAVAAVRRKAKLTTDTALPKGAAPAGVGRHPRSTPRRRLSS